MVKQGVESKTGKSSRDRWVKVGFVLVLVAAALAVYLFQQRDLSIKGWGDDLDVALAQAKAENRRVVVFFVSTPPSDTAKKIARRRIPKSDNQKALREGNFIPVVISLDNELDSDPAKKYKLKTLPTLMVLWPDGTERNRKEGEIGEVEFRQKLLQNKSMTK